MMMNRNKRGIALDLKQEGARDAIKQLIKTADVVIENYRIGTMEKLGLSYEVLKAENPGLIYCEVSGFGRTGDNMWGYQHYDVVPDLVTLGKPMGNGHPLAGVVGKASLVDHFCEQAMYFNTFGGNPVSCAVGLAVLEVIENEGLVAHAHAVGAYVREGLERLGQKHDTIGDIRGRGLFFGAELVKDRTTHEPAPEYTRRIVNALRENGVLVSATGRHDNILKIRPPMPFTTDNADLLLTTLDTALAAA